MALGQTEHRARVDPARKVARDLDVGDQALAHGVIEHVAEARDDLGVGAVVGRDLGRGRKREVPVRVDADLAALRDRVVTRRNRVDAVEDRVRVRAEVEALLEHGLAVPARGNAEGDQRLHLGREVHVALVRGVEERLDPEAVADREHRAVTAVGDHGRELTAQVAPQVHALAQVEVQRDLAVGFGLERAALCAQAIADRAVAVELAVHDDLDVAGRVGDRLVAVIQADDREARVAEEPAPVGRDPAADGVRAAVMERLERAVEALGLQGVVEQPGYESAHGRLPSGRGSGPGSVGIILPHFGRRRG